MEFLTSVGELESLYGEVGPTAMRKETATITDEYRRLIEAAPFIVIATAGSDGMDCSPKGDAAGFVHVIDEQTLAIPDRRGNNRLDGLHNLLEDPRIGILFLIPGIGETLRVNGTAQITTDHALRTSMAVNDILPATVTVVHVESVFFHCSKAIRRSDLWNPDKHRDRRSLPTPGQILHSLSAGDLDAASTDADYDRRQVETLY